MDAESTASPGTGRERPGLPPGSGEAADAAAVAGNGTRPAARASGAVREYVRNVWNAAATVFDGMAVTASYFLRRPTTVEYPDRMPVRVQDTLPPRYRGILEVDLEICTACLACERACPIDCIVIEAKKDKAAGGFVMTRFDIDLAKCMYCGLCSEPCPTGAIHHTTEFEGADYSLESLVRRFVKAPVVAYKPRKDGTVAPEVKPILDRGLRYLREFAKAAGDEEAEEAE